MSFACHLLSFSSASHLSLFVPLRLLQEVRLLVRNGEGNDAAMKVAHEWLCHMLLEKAVEMSPTVRMGQKKKDAWPTRKAAFTVGLKAIMAFKLLNDRGVFAMPTRDMDLMDLERDEAVEALLLEFGCSKKEVLAVKMKKIKAGIIDKMHT